MQIAVNGITQGLAIALLALSFGAVYWATGVFHIAQAGVYAVGPAVAWSCLQHGLPMPLAALAGLVASGAVSLLCELCSHRPLAAKGAGASQQMVASLGLFIVIVQVLSMVFGHDTKELPLCSPPSLSSGSVVIAGEQLVTIVGALLAIGAFWVWSRLARGGILMRALASNPLEAELKGYDVWRIRRWAFFISGVLTGIAAILISNDFGFTVHDGLEAFLFAVVAALVGGRLSLTGAAFGGLLLGLAKSQVVWLLSSEWQQAVAFLLLVVILYLRPHGLIGREARLETAE